MVLIASFVSALVITANHVPAGSPGGGLIRVAPPESALVQDCIRPEDHAAVETALVARQHISDERGAGLPRFRFHPQAGRLYRDLITSNFVDLGPGTIIRDWDCTAISYDGHNGHDVVVRSFAEQEIGVPVFAALDGEVILAVDGHPDMNTQWQGQPANFVALDHGSNFVTYYYHLKNGSVAVTQGEQVRAGQQLGLTASSGNSTYPHIHFETRRFGTRREPSVGPCNTSPSLWTDQYAIDRNLKVFEAGVTERNLDSLPWLPFELPRSGQIALGEPRACLWIQASAMPPFTTWNARILRPNGSIAANSSGNFGNTQTYTSSWWYWWWPTSIFAGQTGVWRYQLTMNGQLHVDAPFEVVAVRDPAFNRPPAPVTTHLITAGAVIPRDPDPDDVIFCEIDADLIHDDPDYDVVRFEYVWTVDDIEIRRLISAAHSDAIPAGAAEVGQMVRCVVTPSDGRGGFAAPSEASVVVVAPCPGDADGDRFVGFTDLNYVLAEFNSAVGSTGLPGDLNQDGWIDFNDLNLAVSSFNTTCE